MSEQKTRRRWVCLLACAAGSLALAAPSQAAVWDWTGGATVGHPGDGNWDNTANWSQGTVPEGANDTILNFLSGLDPYTGTNDLGAFTLNRINYAAGDGNANVTIAGGGANPIAFAGANPGIYADTDSTGALGVNVALSAPGQTLTLHNSLNNDRFRLNPGANNIDADVLSITGGRVVMQSQQNNIGEIRVSGGGILGSSDNNLTTTAVVYFEDETSGIMTGGVGNNNRRMTVGGWQSEVEGAGNIGHSGTAQNQPNTVNVAADQTYTFSGTIGNIGGAAAGRTHIQKTGLGTQIITGNMVSPGQSRQIIVDNGLLHFTSTSTIAGSGNPTDINGGILQIDGLVNHGSGAFNVNAAGTLAGIGEIRRRVEVGGTLMPGGSIGTLTIVYESDTDPALLLKDGFQLIWEYDNGLMDRDLVNVVGQLDLTAALTGTVNLVNLNNGLLKQNDVLISTTGGILGASNIANWTLNGGNGLVLGISSDGNDLILIPEPASMVLMGFGGLLMLRRRK